MSATQMMRGRILAPFVLALVTGLGAGLAACGPAGPSSSDGLPTPSLAASPTAAPTEEPTLVFPTVKPGSTERPILTLEPPQPVVP